MKKLSILLLFCLPLVSGAQEVTKTISKFVVNQIGGEFQQITTEKGQVIHLLFLTYRNAEYEYVYDHSSIMIQDSAQLACLIADLDSALSVMDKKLSERVGNTYTWSKSMYSITLYDFAMFDVYIYDKGKKYTTLNKKQLQKLIEHLRKIQFPATPEE